MKCAILADIDDFINVGSIGQSRAGVRKAICVNCDLDQRSIESHRLDFPTDDAPAALLAVR